VAEDRGVIVGVYDCTAVGVFVELYGYVANVGINVGVYVEPNVAVDIEVGAGVDNAVGVDASVAVSVGADVSASVGASVVITVGVNIGVVSVHLFLQAVVGVFSFKE